MHNPICVKCNREMKAERNGVTAEELLKDGSSYKLWSTDMFKCPDCGALVLSGFGHSPIAENFQEDYRVKVRDYNARYPIVQFK